MDGYESLRMNHWLLIQNFVPMHLLKRRMSSRHRLWLFTGNREQASIDGTEVSSKP
jgi:hypothetical protein